MKNSSDTGSYHMGRQPIFNKDCKTVAYELLFRRPGAFEAHVGDASHATAAVIMNTLSRFGLNSILGKHLGFINFDTNFLLSDSLSLLPSDKIVIELLESVEPDAIIVKRCAQLVAEGFTIALDDHVHREDYSGIYASAGIIKLDVRKLSRTEIIEHVAIFRTKQVQLVAEKVETEEEFLWCRSLGFDLFQGYYFARPVVLKKNSSGLSVATLLTLFQQVMNDAETWLIEKTVKSDPGLSYGLLQLVNSVSYSTRMNIQTVRHAISLLGRRQLRRWVQLAVFASDDERGESNPLLDVAGWRARFMEVAAERHPALAHDPNATETAFLAGTLSVLDCMLGMPMTQLVEELNLHDTVRQALLSRSGAIGQLLMLAEETEKSNFSEADRIAAECGLGGSLFEDEIEASMWREKMGMAV